MSSNLAVNLSSGDASPAGDRSSALVPSNVRVLGELTVKHESYWQNIGRVRFDCEALRDQSELSLVLCQELVKQEGIKTARVNTWCAALVVDFDTDILNREQLITLLGRMAISCSDHADLAQTSPRILRSIYNFISPFLEFVERLLPAAAQLFISGAAFASAILGLPNTFTRPLLFISILPIGLRALNVFLAEGKIGVDALDGMAATLMLSSGKLKEACFMTALIGLGEYIRERTATHCRKMVDDLLSLSGRSAWLVKGRKRVCIPVDQVKVGDVLVIYPGELVPVDGIIIDGQAAIDQSKLTGESLPIELGAGDQVYAATILLEGKVYIRCLSVGSDTRAGAVLQSLKDVPIHETRIQNYAALMADKLVVPIMLGAGICFIITRNPIVMMSMLIFDFSTGIRIAAPTAVLSSMYNAGRKGILVKSGASLERLSQVSAIIFDKTGTLTLGEPKVTNVVTIGNGNGGKPLYGADDIIALAAAVEQRHHHPAARAIIMYASHKQIVVEDRSQSSQMRGMGVKAKIENKTVLVGSRRLLESENIDIKHALVHETQIANAGESIAYVAVDSVLVGLIAYSDQIRPEAVQAIKQLKKLGVRKIYMATGDGEIVAKQIANMCGITDYRSRVFPEQKAELVRELKAEGHTVAVIGDGINDSPALAHADIAFSLHGCTEAAREGADIVLTDGDLRRLPEAIRIARGAMNLVKENLTLAIIPNGAGLGMAAFGLVGPAGATILNNGSAIVCALNSLRPLYSDPWSKAELIIKE